MSSLDSFIQLCGSPTTFGHQVAALGTTTIEGAPTVFRFLNGF